MNNHEALEESVKSWELSVEHDRSQIRYDVRIIGYGALLAGVGLGAAVCGVPEGVLGMGVGGVMGGVGVKSLNDDLEMYQSSTAVLRARRQELEQQAQ